MEFINKSKVEIKKKLCNKNNPNPNDTIQIMEELAREQGSTTGNLEDYSFKMEVEDSLNGMIVKNVVIIQ